ncbi:hypothetical protein CRX72_05065 [Pantoea sp. BRM17]|nr:hypothetical protein CRX72_05065 [Pantoea sp. BRM17]
MRSDAVPLNAEAVQALADRILSQIAILYTAHQISPTPVQQQMLIIPLILGASLRAGPLYRSSPAHSSANI